MKIQITRSARTVGSILLVALATAIVIGIMLASYLILVSGQSKSVARSQIWNNSLVVTEAGVEDGMELLNRYIGTDNLGAWTTTYASDGWTRPGGGTTYQLTRYMDAAHTIYYQVTISNISNAPILHSVGYVPGPSWLSGAPPLTRTVEVSTKIQVLFNVAMAALGTIDLKGNNIRTDSYDSSDPAYSDNGRYAGLTNSAMRKAGGDVATDNTITNSVLTVGNANVAGHVMTGPNGSVTIGPNGSVGDLAWVDSNTSGIEPGWSVNDMNVVFPDVVLPSPSGGWVTTLGAGTGGSGTAPDGKTYAHIFTSGTDTATTPGYYTITDSGDIYVGTNVHVRLNITTSTFKPNNIYVAGVGIQSGRMTGYLNGSSGQSVTLGSTDVTQSGIPVNLAFFGLTNCTSISYKGNGDFTGVIYAPEADFQLAGGGSSTMDFIGSSVTKTVQMNGHYNFHYDESLKKSGQNLGYVANGWRER